jgi:hypothetical protein
LQASQVGGRSFNAILTDTCRLPAVLVEWDLQDVSQGKTAEIAFIHVVEGLTEAHVCD